LAEPAQYLGDTVPRLIWVMTFCGFAFFVLLNEINVITPRNKRKQKIS